MLFKNILSTRTSNLKYMPSRMSFFFSLRNNWKKQLKPNQLVQPSNVVSQFSVQQSGISTSSFTQSKDTIYALSSGAGRAGVAIIRISGSEASAVLSALRKKSTSTKSNVIKPRYAHLTNLYDPDDGNHPIDSALILWFPGPNSFTGEDVLELHVHGSRAVTQKLFSVFDRLPGVRPAEAGEFARRAFFNNKLDLTEVEALADLIDADTEEQRKLAVRQMSGELSKMYEHWRAELVKALSHVEAVIDFGDDEDDIGDQVYQAVADRVQTLHSQIQEHLDDKRRGEIIREGINVSIVGPPNAGKSTLLNLLAKRQAAIVSDIPGTTRDVIEVSLDIEGFPVKLCDTAGLRETTDAVEAVGVQLAKDRLQSAQICIAVFDAKDIINCTSDLEIRSLVKDVLQGTNASDKSLRPAMIVLLNKFDLIDYENIDANDSINLLKTVLLEHNITEIYSTSFAEGRGVSSFVTALGQHVSSLWSNVSEERVLITRARHRRHLLECKTFLERTLETTHQADLTAEELRLAMRSLGKITGVVDVEELLDTIFADFCIGK